MLINIKEAYTDRIPIKKVILAQDLRQTSQIKEINENLFKEIKMALKTCLAYNQIGISANQIGINKSFFLIRENEENFKVYLNPKVERSGHLLVKKRERCLSVPGFTLLVERPIEIAVKWEEIENNNLFPTSQFFDKKKARVFLHQLDHLKGLSTIDKSCEHNRAGKQDILKQISQR